MLNGRETENLWTHPTAPFQISLGTFWSLEMNSGFQPMLGHGQSTRCLMLSDSSGNLYRAPRAQLGGVRGWPDGSRHIARYCANIHVLQIRYKYRQQFEHTLRTNQLIQRGQACAWVTEHTHTCVCVYICIHVHRGIFKYTRSIAKRKRKWAWKKRKHMCAWLVQDFTAVWEIVIVSPQ